MKGRPRRAGPYHHGDLPRALLETTVQIIRESGVAQVSMREVAGRLGVTMGAPYHHFRDKDDLLAAVAAHGFQRLQGHVLQALQAVAARPGRERIEALGRAYVGFAMENPAEYSVMFLPQFRDRPRFPALHEAGGRSFDLVVALVSEALCLTLDEAVRRVVSLWSRWHGFACLVNDAVLTSKPGLPPMSELIAAVVDV